MCDFKVGNEVVCVDARPGANGRASGLELNGVYTVRAIVRPMTHTGLITDHSRWLVELEEVSWNTGYDHLRGAYRPERFRKVQRRNWRLTLEAFFTVPGGFEEPKRAPAKTPERV